MKKYIVSLLILSFCFSNCATKTVQNKMAQADILAEWQLPDNNIWWSAKDGVIHAQSGPEKKGSILWTKKDYESFVIEADFLMGKGTVDSGIFIRSENQQIQIGESGSLKRDLTGSPYIPGKGYPSEASGVAEILKKTQWNTIKVQAIDNVYTIWLNGQQVLVYESTDAIAKGPIGLQLHPNRDMDISFKNVSITEMKNNRIQLINIPEKQKVDVHIDGSLFTSYTYPTSIKKPVLYPLITPMGTKITRKFPLEPSEGERVDHPHHVGLWLNYGDVNGLDFWNNSDAIDPSKRDGYGTIVHKNIVSYHGGEEQGQLEVTMDWTAPDGTILLTEQTKFVFAGSDDEYHIDRITKLSAGEQRVNFNDNKEGMIGIRVTRALEHPSDQPAVFTDANGVATTVKALNNEGVNGMYINAEGIQGETVWAKRSNWVNLNSNIGSEKISLAILDHKANVGYPTYWHARGYGLFAANPLGQAVFSEGKETLNFKLEKGESTTFKHRIIIASKTLDTPTLNQRFTDFSSH